MKNVLRSLFLGIMLPLVCTASPPSFGLSQSQEESLTTFINLFCELPIEELVTQSEPLKAQLTSFMQVSLFQLMGFILSNSTLAENLGKVLRDPQKSDFFMQGFRFRMMQETAKVDFQTQLEDFCALFSLKHDVMKSFVEKGDWNRFLLYSFKGSLKQ